MRKLPLLVAAGALWLFVAALPVLADGGPHQVTTNNGTGVAGLTADSCAGCHRAHTAKAAGLLKMDQTALCLDCHNGTKATTDVVNGQQLTSAGGTAVLGALRGGGFEWALIDTRQPARLSYASSRGVSNIGHVQVLTTAQKVTSTHEGAGTVWGNGAVSNGVGAAVDLECANCHNPHGNQQYRILQTRPTMVVATGTVKFAQVATTAAVEIQDTTTTGTHNYTVRPASDGWNANGSAANVVTGTSGDYWRYHWDPTGTLSWALTSGGPGADPMETGFLATSPITNQAAYKTYASASTTVAFAMVTAASDTNYGKLFVGAVTGFPTAPNFNVTVESEIMTVTKLTPPSGTGTGPDATSWTLSVSRGVAGTALAAHALDVAVTMAPWNYTQNVTGLMTAWCVTCHTRYSGQPDALGNASSLVDTSGGDKIFMFKHGTTRIGCEQCHVSHGSNAVMGNNGLAAGPNSLGYTDPAGNVPPTTANAGLGNAYTSGDSRLLKVDNRGTCQLCHDPTGSITAGTYIGPTSTPGN